MKKFIVIILGIILFSIIISAYNNNPKVIISRLTKREGLIKGGDLKYRIYLLGVIPLGEAVFSRERIEPYDKKNVYHLSASAQSLKLFSNFFNASAVFDSYVDMDNLNPILFKQRIKITGKKDMERIAFYDQKNKVMTIDGVKRQILPNTQDPLSAMLNLRRLDFDKLKDIEMNINTNQKNYILKGMAKEEELSININKKIYKIVKAEATIQRRDKNPYHKTSITMILLREKENIPLLIRVFASGVLIYGRLIE
ncbi:MAG: DUF3108 domain-containing protein [Candidatus Omnitrophica bacterium]|nr:DUF3108 domain-containing protein [Candidatus Omnitrophota bacterium]